MTLILLRSGSIVLALIACSLISVLATENIQAIGDSEEMIVGTIAPHLATFMQNYGIDVSPFTYKKSECLSRANEELADKVPFRIQEFLQTSDLNHYLAMEKPLTDEQNFEHNRMVSEKIDKVLGSMGIAGKDIDEVFPDCYDFVDFVVPLSAKYPCLNEIKSINHKLNNVSKIFQAAEFCNEAQSYLYYAKFSAL